MNIFPRAPTANFTALMIAGLEKGNGSPVVLLHGNQAMADDFEISGTFDLHMLHRAYPEKVVAKIEALCAAPELDDHLR